MAELSYAQVSALLKYDSETGKLFWLERPVSMFKDTATGDAASRAKAWNTRYSGKQAFTAINNYGYYVGRVLRVTGRLHRIAWLLHYGKFPKGQIDHINGDRKDNRIANLRDVPPLENSRNMGRYARNKSGVCGVSMCSRTGKWTAHISVKGRGIYLGRFMDIDSAREAREAANIRFGFSARHGQKG